MTTPEITAAQIEALKRFPSPTVANAIETFEIRPRNTGFLSSRIRCLFPELGPMVGFACTATVRANLPKDPGEQARRFGWWDYLAGRRGPKVVVMQDLDDPPVGAYWGEVNANIHRALGCVGVVTNGGVRDLPEARALGFQFCAAEIQVSHAYTHLIGFGEPVYVGGQRICPGDLLHADEHGVVLVPLEVVPELPRRAQAIEAAERRIIELCRSPQFNVEALKDAYKMGY